MENSDGTDLQSSFLSHQSLYIIDFGIFSETENNSYDPLYTPDSPLIISNTLDIGLLLFASRISPSKSFKSPETIISYSFFTYCSIIFCNTCACASRCAHRCTSVG